MERKGNIDVLRIISAIAVVTIHVVTSPVGNAVGPVSAVVMKQLNLVHNSLMWAVPVFFMITGYCLVNKKECTYEYCFRHVSKYAATLFTVGFFYAILELVFQSHRFSFKILGTAIINVVGGKLWEHMWFVYAIMGVYLVMPVLHHFMKREKKDIIILTGLLFLFTIILPFCGNWFVVGIDFPFGGYLFYVCFGGCVARLGFSRKISIGIYIMSIVAMIYIIIVGKTETYDYKSIEVALMAMGIFCAMAGLKMKQNEFVRMVAECTWGIYLLHPLFINITVKVMKIDLLRGTPYLNLILFELIIVIVSFICTYILKKLPLLKRMF